MRKTLALSLLLLAPMSACNKDQAPAKPTVAPVAAAPAVAPPAPDAKLAEITLADVEKRRTEANFFVYDNNTKDRYATGHVPGARWLDPMTVAATDLPADKSATLVFYCANNDCSACHEGARAAIKLGYKNVFIMPDGIAGWESAKLPTEKKVG